MLNLGYRLGGTILRGGAGTRPSLNLNFLSGTLDSRITFTRSTTGTFVGSNGLIQTAAINAPRFDYNPATLSPRGLLIEEQRTNSVVHSEELDNGAWHKDHITLTVNAATAPSGTTTAEKAIPNNGEDLTAISHGVVRQNVNHTAGATLTFSVFAKQAEFNHVELYFSEGTGSTNLARVRYSLVDGSIVTAPTVEGTFTNASSTSTPFGNDWYRFTLTFTTAGASAVGRARIAIRDSVITIGNGTSGILLWGAQVEEGAFATSYIPTVASTVTRTRDLAVMTGTNFSSWYNLSEGTIVWDATSFSTSSVNAVVNINNSTSANRIYGYFSATAVIGVVTTTSSEQVSFNSGTLSGGLSGKTAFAYALNSFAQSTRGAAVITDSSGTVPTVSQMNIGTSHANVQSLNGHIRAITYYPQRIHNPELQILSASDASLDLNFLSGTLDPRITFTRSTTGTFVGSNGLVQSAAINVPRFDYDPTTLALKGLLIEEQRANLATYSQEPSNVAWGKTRASITADVVTAPDGTLTGDKLVEDTSATNTHRTSVPTISMTSGTSYTFSIFLKAGERTFAVVTLSATSAGSAFGQNPVVFVNLLTGAVSSVSGTVTAYSVVAFPDGWWRVSVSALATLTTTNTPTVFLAVSGSSNAYTGNGTSGLFLWGGQVEAATFPTSYIPTVESTVTRAVDGAIITGTNFSSWYNASEGTIVFSGDSVRPTGIAPATRTFQFDDDTTSNNIRSGGTSTLQVVDATIVQVNIAGVPLIPFDGTVFKFASAYKLNDFATVTTGAVVTDTSGTIPTVTQLSLGGPANSGVLNGHIRKFTYYPQRRDNAQLLGLTV